MKLHLPKSLLLTLLSALTLATPLAVTLGTTTMAVGEWGNDGPSGAQSCVYYVDDIETLVDATSGDRASITELYLAQAVDGNTPSGSKPALIEELLLKSGDTMTVKTHPWKDGSVNFSLLTIENITIGDGTGNAKFNVNENQGVLINNVNGSITGEINGTLTFEGTEENELNIAYSGVDAFTGSGVLVIGDHATVTVDRGDGGNSAAAIQSNIKILGGGTMNVTKMDAMGWGADGTYAALITLEGNESKDATLTIAGDQTMGSEFNLNGHAIINGTGAITPVKKNGIIISASGTSNTIAAGLLTRDSITLNVAEESELTVSGLVSLSTNIGHKGNDNYETSSIIKKGAGTVYFTNGDNVFGNKYYNESGVTEINAAATFTNGISITGGQLKLGADIKLGKAIALNGGTLALGEGHVITIAVDDLSDFDKTYRSQNDLNGFGYTDYVIISGVTDSNVTGTATYKLGENEIQLQNGIYVTETVYIVNVGDVQTDSASVSDATQFVVYAREGQQTGNLIIKGNVGDLTAAQILTQTEGNGKMSLQTDVTLAEGGSVAFAGNLEIATGGKLTLGKGGNNQAEYPTDLSSLSSLDLNGGTLNMHYVAPHIKSMTVVEGSTNSKIYIDDTAENKLANKADATRIDSLLLDADLTMETNWKSNVNIGVLSGDSNLTATQTNSNEGKASHLWIDGVDNYTGEMSLKGKLNLSLNSGNTETEQAVRLSVDDFIGNIDLGGKVAASLNIGESEFLNKSQLTVDSGSSATLTGSGLYNLGASTSLGSGVSLSNDTWTGTVRIQGDGNSQNDLNLKNLSNENSAVELINVKGWFSTTTTTPMAGALVLTKDTDGKAAWTISDGSSKGQDYAEHDIFTMATFEGSVSGDGTMKYEWTGGGGYTGFTFSGDVSEWTGEFVQTVGNKQFNMVLKGEADTVNAEIKRSAENARLHLRVATDAAATFNKTIDVTKLTLAQSVGFSSGTENTVAGALTIEADAGKSISLTNDTTLSVTGGLTSNYGLSITGGAGGVTLSGATNSISGGLSIASGNSLTLAKGSALTVNSPIQNGGNLDIQGTVNWNLASTEGLTVTYSEAELSIKENGLRAGVISGLITGNSTLVDNGNVAATVNDKTGTLATGTGLVTAADVVYYVMNTPKLDEPENLKEDRPGEVYSFANGKEVLISDVVHVGVHDRSDPEAAEGANTALGFYVGEDGVLCIMGDSETMTAGEILASTQGSGDIILRTPGYRTDDMFPTDTITLSSKTNVTGNLYLSPYVRYKEQGEWARPQAGISLHLNAGADISSFSAVHLCHPQSVIMINGEIGKSDITGGHINNLTSSGASEVFLCFNKAANSEIILAGKTTIQGYEHGSVTSEDGTGNSLASNLYLDVNHEDVNIVIEELNGKQIDWWNTGYVTFSTGLSDNYGGEDLTSISGTLDINSFKYEGYVALMPVLENSTLHTNITLLGDAEDVEDEQLIDSQIYFVLKNGDKTVQGDASLTIKGAGRYILSDGNSIDYSSWTDETWRYNFGVLDSNWTGTVEVNNLDATIDAIQGIKIADYGNENSTIHFKGFKGYLKDSTTAVEIKPDLILENSDTMNAYEIANGYTGQVQTYKGDIRGTGDFVVSAASNMTFNLQGNLSEWKDGAELKVTAGTQAVNFSDAATVINADVLATNGATMNADISNTKAVTVSGKVKADGGTLNLSVNTEQGTTFTNEVNVTKISVGSGSTAKLEAASSAGNISIGSYGKDKVATLSDGLTIEENTVGHGYIADAKISHIQEAGTVELVEVSASNLYLYGGKQVQFHSTDSKNQFTFDKQITYGSERVNEVVFTSEIFRGMILSEDGAQLTLTVDNAVVWDDAVQPDWTNVTIELKGFTIEQLAGKAGDWDWDKFGLSFDPNSASVATLDNAALSTTVSELLNADYDFVVYEQNASGLTIRMYNTPEPTTATLSMLALAALAARRRRASR